MKRSSLFILHKRCWFRMQLIKLVIPIRPKSMRNNRANLESLAIRQEMDEEELN
jgi:hypothetical protein